MRQVRPRLEGRRVVAARVLWRPTVGGRGFERRVIGARIVRVWRRAKYIVMELERAAPAGRGAGRLPAGRGAARFLPAGALVGHLRMTGRMLVAPREAPQPAYAKVALELDDGRTFWFVDVRKFGRLLWRADAQAALAHLGPEPLDGELTAESFLARLRARRRQLKPLLLDQAFLAVLGNIYADVVLHCSRLHPLASSAALKLPQAARLLAAIRAVLQQAIAREGSSFDGFYRTPEGQPGAYQEQFLVYGREGEPCRGCGAAIRRLVVAQRGTHVCPRCQCAPHDAAQPARLSRRAISRPRPAR